MSSDPLSAELGASGRPVATPPPFARVAVVGLGVMGGSLARAVARGWPNVRVSGWSPDPLERREAYGAGVIDEPVGAPEDAVSGADLVVLAVPIDAALDLLDSLAGPSGDATVMDVVSLKAPLADAAERAGLTGRWVGAHPMAGSEASGFGASRADLYRRRRVWLCGSPSVKEGRGEAVEAFWNGLDARPTWIGPREHDVLMALVSHVPQLASNALAAELAARGVRVDDLGPGGRDVTRLAASSPEMWSGLLARAPGVLAEALRGVGARLEEVAEALDSGEIARVEAIMESTRAWRRNAGEDLS